MKDVERINLKPKCNNRKEFIDFCLNNDKANQYLAIGWHHVYLSDEKKFDEKKFKDYKSFYKAVENDEKSKGKNDGKRKRINHALNAFRDAEVNDLFWTRDLEGYYWICRVKGKAQPCLKEEMDIGAVLPVEAYKVGLEVPGQIKASFNRPRGGTAEKIGGQIIKEFSKNIYNLKSGKTTYEYEKIEGNLLDNLPDFELEELVISYLQIKENYYLLSNSIAKKSTTLKIECEFISRDKTNPRKAVVQVKGGKKKILNALDYKDYSDDGCVVYLFAPKIINSDKVKNTVEISKDDLIIFFEEYKNILPDSITMWENLFE